MLQSIIDPRLALATVEIPISFEDYDATPDRNSESNIHGALTSLILNQPLDSVPTDIVVSKGIGKIMISVNAGSDFTGSITITGESIDRNTGDSTPGDTEVIVVDTLTTNNSTTDSNGNVVHNFVNAYISLNWFTGSVTLSTTNLTLTDVNVYHISFEQFNDKQNIVLNTFDINLLTTNASAQLDAYLYRVTCTDNKCNIANVGALHIGTDGETAIANKYWRLRQAALNSSLDGTTDGAWLDIHYSNSPTYVEDVTVKIWATQTQSISLS